MAYLKLFQFLNSKQYIPAHLKEWETNLKSLLLQYKQDTKFYKNL